MRPSGSSIASLCCMYVDYILNSYGEVSINILNIIRQNCIGIGTVGIGSANRYRGVPSFSYSC